MVEQTIPLPLIRLVNATPLSRLWAGTQRSRVVLLLLAMPFTAQEQCEQEQLLTQLRRNVLQQSLKPDVLPPRVRWQFMPKRTWRGDMHDVHFSLGAPELPWPNAPAPHVEAIRLLTLLTMPPVSEQAQVVTSERLKF